jgi:creatinine amidohydrolase
LLGPEGPASFAWLSEDLNTEGVIGNAAAATAGQGARLVDFYAERIAGVLAETAELNIDAFTAVQ